MDIDYMDIDYMDIDYMDIDYMDIDYSELPKTFIKVDEEILRTAIEIVKISVENTKMLLDEHDFNFGRDSRKNKQWAETLEKDLKEMISFQEKLFNILGFSLSK